MRRKGDETRQRIVEAAYKLFYKNGFASSSIDAVAEAAGITKKTFYYHFESKQALIASVFEKQNELVLASIESWAGKDVGSPLQFVDRIFSKYAEWAGKPGWRSSGFTRAAMEFAGSPGHPARRAARRHKTEVERWFAARFAAGGITNAPELAREVMLLMEGCHSLVLIHANPAYTAAAGRAARALVAAAS